MTLSALTILIVGLVAVLVLVIGLWAYATANRLDRLHVRSDLSWQSLDSALARRAVVARAVASATRAQLEDSRRLAALADAAERADRAHREAAENAVSVALATLDPDDLPPQLVAELADAEARVLIARRFHNDAVRDTLALRTTAAVRALHLGGTAPLPTYFEIAERSAADTFGSEGRAVQRTSARVVLVDERGRVLLLRGHDPTVPDVYFWFTIGGAVEPGENLREAAVREVREETGLGVASTELKGPMWRRVATFPFNGVLLRSEELFFALRTQEFEPEHSGFTDFERRTVTGHKWCTEDDIRSLAATGETVYPQDLAELLDEVNIVLARRTEPDVRAIR
ncbi:NUDIX hydrolase [Rhodococcoides fascians]|jgi:8-oxo-dGTP pyrophosphatase MutT (NUDIX family)|uniref:NUDIX hydrolase n=1 Tax=Rhodococcoides fascians TaxID=1828 RepID=UPI0005601287|nr:MULTISPECIES: NUDIX domain-containing protein [Rhodococcus]OZE94553.1 NUDIX domain-containing protein [Rhodococcus sp. 15-1189-1-1a]OZF09637.1 NUDIX domain-containing protein [Rhodococcus sp. 14-2686-1-2]